MNLDAKNDGRISSTPTRANRACFALSSTVVGIAIISPRAAAALFLISLFTAVALLGHQRVTERPQMHFFALPTAMLAFGTYALLSSLWSPVPMASLTKPLFLMGGALGTAILFVVARQADDQLLRSSARGILLGLFFGGLFVAFEILSGQALTRLAFTLIPGLQAGMEKHLFALDGRVVAIGSTNINRRVTIVAMLMIPAGLLLLHAPNQHRRMIGYAALALLAAVLMIYGEHESSKAALIAGAGAFGLAMLSQLWALRLLAIAWCVSTVLIVPMVMAVHKSNVHLQTHLLAASARQRVVIWNHTAEQAMKAPLLGIGADATPTVTAEAEANRKRKGDVADREAGFERTTARHAHNVFLQIWYELGAVGAGLFTLIGLTALVAIARAPTILQPYLMAQFAAVSTMIGFSYSIWQLWFEGAIGLGVLAVLTGVLLSSNNATDRN
jgi:O-Antigen ligase